MRQVLACSSQGLPQYAFDDFSISQVAKILGKSADGKKVSVS